MLKDPETYYFYPTTHVPNSNLPALVYRQVLPAKPTESTVRDAIERNHWIKGGVWKAYTAHHFHSVTHECYAVFKGKSRLLLGRGPLDDPADGGAEVDVEAGDIIVLPVRNEDPRVRITRLIEAGGCEPLLDRVGGRVRVCGTVSGKSTSWETGAALIEPRTGREPALGQQLLQGR